MGASNNQTARKVALPLNFLKANTNYQLTLYADAADADWRKNPSAYKVLTKQVTAKDNLHLELAAGGGAAIELVPLILPN